MSYDAFLARKAILDPPTGLEIAPDLPGALFPFQRDITAWALKRGRAAIFAGTGLGKSFMELAWADAVHRETGKDILHLAPLAVSAQMVREARKFGLPATHVKAQAECLPGDNVTNYHKLEHFDLSRFGGVILDQWVSILIWQRYASPVWMDINQHRTLQYRGGRDEKDEAHISPLQLDVIERCIDLWSMPGDTVLTPFLGIGSEVFGAIERGRRGIGFELKPSYFKQAVKNLREASDIRSRGDLLSLVERSP